MNFSKMPPHSIQTRNISLRTHGGKASQNQLEIFMEKVDMEQKKCVKSTQSQKLRLWNELREIHRVYAPQDLPPKMSRICEVTKKQKSFLDCSTKTEKIEEKSMSTKGKVPLSRTLTDPLSNSTRTFPALSSCGRINNFPPVSRTVDNSNPTSVQNDSDKVIRKARLARRVTVPHVNGSSKSFSLSQDRRRNNSCPTVLRIKDDSIRPGPEQDCNGAHDSTISSASLPSPPSSVSESLSRLSTATSYRAFKKLVRAKKQALTINVERLNSELNPEENCFAFVTPARIQNARQNSEIRCSLDKDFGSSKNAIKTRERSLSVPSKMPHLENLSMDDNKMIMNVSGTDSKEKALLFAQPTDCTGKDSEIVLDGHVKSCSLRNGQGVIEYHDNTHSIDNNTTIKRKSVSFAGIDSLYF